MVESVSRPNPGVPASAMPLWARLKAISVAGAVGGMLLGGLELVSMLGRVGQRFGSGDLLRLLAVGLLVGTSLGTVASLATVPVLPWLSRLRHRRVVVLGLAAIALAGALVDAWLYTNLYPDAHALLGLGTLACAIGAAVLALGSRPAGYVGAAVPWIATALTLTALPRLVGDRHSLRHPLLTRTNLVGRTLSALLEPVSTGGDSGCESSPPRPIAPEGGYEGASVLLVTIDAFRGDLGGTRLADALPKTTAALGSYIPFDRAHAPAPRTTYSTYSMLTGRHPHRLGFVAATTDVDDRFHRLADDDPIMIDPRKWKLRHRYPLGDETPTLAGILGRAGYRTAAVVADVSLLPEAGITREFDSVDRSPYDRNERRDHGGVTSGHSREAALAFLREVGDDPFLMWIHFRDPHHPYTPYGGVDPSAPAAARYFSEFRRVDDELVQILDALERDGRRSRTLVVITGDHGEEFRDHGGLYHGTTLYQELVHVPLLLALPGDERPAVVSEPVSLTDLTPTIVDLLGIDTDVAFDGRSLRTMLHGDPMPDHVVFAYNTSYTASNERQAALIEGDLKLIEDEARGTLQLFDLREDPGEQHNIADIHPEVARAIRCRLRATQAFENDG